MYIRWIVRKHKNTATANVAFHDAYLVESYRNDRDAPRQRTICYLGNIRQIDDGFPALEREIFFLRAERIIASTPDIPPDERELIADLLREKIPPLTETEVMIAFRNNIRWFLAWYRLRDRAIEPAELLRMAEDSDEALDPI